MLEGVARVRGAFAADGPARAVVVRILACALADAARDGAVQIHVAGILVALVVVRPVVAVYIEVGAFGRADPARGGAMLEHVVWRRLALALLRPRGARLISVGTDVVARSARVWADALDMVGIAASALAGAAPRGA